MRYFPFSSFRKGKMFEIGCGISFSAGGGKGKTCVVLFRLKGKEAEEEEGPFCSPDIFSLSLLCMGICQRAHMRF